MQNCLSASLSEQKQCLSYCSSTEQQNVTPNASCGWGCSAAEHQQICWLIAIPPTQEGVYLCTPSSYQWTRYCQVSQKLGWSPWIYRSMLRMLVPAEPQNLSCQLDNLIRQSSLVSPLSIHIPLIATKDASVLHLLNSKNCYHTFLSRS